MIGSWNQLITRGEPMLAEPPAWTADAACASLTPSEADRLFFPEPPHDYSAEARRMCASCPVRIDCMVLGKGEEYGMFGGITPRQRLHDRKVA